MKNEDKTMSPHFVKVVAEIDHDIAEQTVVLARLHDMRISLIELYGGETELPPAPSPASRPPKGGTPNLEPRRAKANVPSIPATATASVNRAPTGDMIKAMTAARTCPEPFTTASLMVATGLERKFISNRLWCWVRQGYVEKAGRGAFKRSANFPAETPHK